MMINNREDKNGKPQYERAFCIRMKSTLTKRGCHFKVGKVKFCPTSLTLSFPVVRLQSGAPAGPAPPSVLLHSLQEMQHSHHGLHRSGHSSAPAQCSRGEAGDRHVRHQTGLRLQDRSLRGQVRPTRTLFPPLTFSCPPECPTCWTTVPRTSVGSPCTLWSTLQMWTKSNKLTTIVRKQLRGREIFQSKIVFQ